MLDDRKRAVGAGAIEFKRASGSEDAGGGDFRPVVFHPIRHIHHNVVFIAGSRFLIG